RQGNRQDSGSVRQPKEAMSNTIWKCRVAGCRAWGGADGRDFACFLGQVIQQECPDSREQIQQKNWDIPYIGRQCRRSQDCHKTNRVKMSIITPLLKSE